MRQRMDLARAAAQGRLPLGWWDASSAGTVAGLPETAGGSALNQAGAGDRLGASFGLHALGAAVADVWGGRFFVAGSGA